MSTSKITRPIVGLRFENRFVCYVNHSDTVSQHIRNNSQTYSMSTSRMIKAINLRCYKNISSQNAVITGLEILNLYNGCASYKFELVDTYIITLGQS